MLNKYHYYTRGISIGSTIFFTVHRCAQHPDRQTDTADCAMHAIWPKGSSSNLLVVSGLLEQVPCQRQHGDNSSQTPQ